MSRFFEVLLNAFVLSLNENSVPRSLISAYVHNEDGFHCGRPGESALAAAICSLRDLGLSSESQIHVAEAGIGGPQAASMVHGAEEDVRRGDAEERGGPRLS